MAQRGGIHPACSICQDNVGVSYYDQKLYAPARAKYELALALRPDRLRVHGNLGLVLYEMGDVDGALRHIRIALDDSPNDPKILTNMAHVLLTPEAPRRGDGVSRARIRNRADVRPRPRQPRARALGDRTPERALAHLTRALELKPDESTVHIGLARVHLALGDYEAARAKMLSGHARPGGRQGARARPRLGLVRRRAPVAPAGSR